MKVSNTVFLLLGCAFFIPSSYASAPAPEEQLASKPTADPEIKLLTAEFIRLDVIASEKKELKNAFKEKMAICRRSNVKIRAAYARYILENLAPKASAEELADYVKREISTVVCKEASRLVIEFDGKLSASDRAEILQPLDEVIKSDLYDYNLAKAPMVKRYLESDACKVQ